MKTRNFLAVGLAFLVISSANAYTLSSDDQVRVDGAVSKIETTISKKWELYRPRIISQLQGYLPKVKNNERITAMLQTTIDNVSHVKSVEIKNVDKLPTTTWTVTPVSIEITPDKGPITYMQIFIITAKWELQTLREAKQDKLYLQKINEYIESIKKNLSGFVYPENTILLKQFQLYLQELLDGKIDPNTANDYQNVIIGSMQKRTETYLNMLSSTSEKQQYIQQLIKTAQKQCDTVDTKVPYASFFQGVYKWNLESLKKTLESLNKDN